MIRNPAVELWANAISTHSENGRKIMFRYAKELSPSFDRTTQPDRIILSWIYQSETGLPVKEERERMDRLEDAIEPVMAEGNFATLALVSTGEDLREWTYYARSQVEFMARLNYALLGAETFPIEVHPDSDPQWSMYEEFKAGIAIPPDGGGRI